MWAERGKRRGSNVRDRRYFQQESSSRHHVAACPRRRTGRALVPARESVGAFRSPSRFQLRGAAGGTRGDGTTLRRVPSAARSAGGATRARHARGSAPHRPSDVRRQQSGSRSAGNALRFDRIAAALRAAPETPYGFRGARAEGDRHSAECPGRGAARSTSREPTWLRRGVGSAWNGSRPQGRARHGLPTPLFFAARPRAL